VDPDIGLMLRVFFLVVASLTAVISSEIKAMAVAVVVEDGLGAGTTAFAELRVRLFDFVFGMNGTVGCECCLNQSRKLLFFVLPLLCCFKGNEGHLHRLVVL
jgi:hypothetical protein